MLAKKLISYYQNELAYLKTQGKAFARHFPKVARRLGMSEGTSEDPHIERMIESFALVTAQIQQRLDEDMPEVTDALLTVLAPQFLRPFPSVCIVQMLPDSKVSALTASNRIDAGTALYSRPVNGQICRFRTTYPVILQPVSLHKASLHLDDDDMSWSLKMQLSVWPGATLTAETLRIHLRGTSTIVNILYTLLCSEVESLSLLRKTTVIPCRRRRYMPWALARMKGCCPGIHGFRRRTVCCRTIFSSRKSFILLICRCPRQWSLADRQNCHWW